MRNATLCLPLKDGKILLGMKKRGFGQGKLNGFGGKINDSETVEQAALRELEEEVGIKATKMEKVAELDFKFPIKTEWNQLVHVFVVSSWQGEPKESEEMGCEWHDPANLPFDRMWQDDRHWLPKVLEGKKLKANFYFDEDNNSIKNFKIDEHEAL